MPSSNRLVHTVITCHQIHSHVRNLFGSYLPVSYHLTMYDAETAEFIHVNQNVLDYGRNPFQSNSSINSQQNENMTHRVYLYVVQASPVIDENNIQPSTSSQDIILSEHNYSSTSPMSEQECQQDLPICDSTSPNSMSHSEDLSNALLNKNQSDIDVFIDNLFAIDNEQASAAYSFENQPDLKSIVNKILSDDNNPDSTDLFDALLSEEPPVPDPAINDHSLEQITIGDTMPPRNETQIIELDRLYFSLDVKPEQKVIYISDQINQKDETKTNGYVTRIQGIKTPAQKMCSVWPIIRIAKSYRRKHNVRVVVYVVSEKQEHGMRIWSKDRDKGFLPKNFTRNTRPTNPIEIDFTECDLTTAGDFKLDLQMTTMWNKSFMDDEEVYRLNEDRASNLHPAEHDSSTPRLLCVLQEGAFIDWDTFCLSDFIRSRKRGLTSTKNTAPTNGSVCKRARIK